MPFSHHRTIHFKDTDAAGVVYFSNVLTICHEAYEASLSAVSIPVKSFFCPAETAFPIVHASVDFFRPLFCGDRVVIDLIPNQTSTHEFEIRYALFLVASDAEQAPVQSDRPSSKAYTRHVCIDGVTRRRKDLPAEITQWLHHWNSPEPA